jgi:hypothetical protein
MTAADTSFTKPFPAWGGGAATPDELARDSLTSPGTMLSRLSIINGPYLSAGLHRRSLQVVVDGNYPNFHALRSYFTTDRHNDTALNRESWAKPLRELIKLGFEVAPIDRLDCEVAAIFTFDTWGPVPELTRELGMLYIDAGFLRLDKPLHGRLPSPGHQNGDEGFLPLASAILHRQDQAVRMLLDAGASMNLGPLTEGGADVDAIEYATKVGAPEIISLLVAHAMNRQVSSTLSSQPALDDPHGSAPSPVGREPSVPSPRRRMGV